MAETVVWVFHRNYSQVWRTCHGRRPLTSLSESQSCLPLFRSTLFTLTNIAQRICKWTTTVMFPCWNIGVKAEKKFTPIMIQIWQQRQQGMSVAKVTTLDEKKNYDVTFMSVEDRRWWRSVIVNDPRHPRTFWAVAPSGIILPVILMAVLSPPLSRWKTNTFSNLPAISHVT